MTDIEKTMREAAEKLLKEKKVDLIIGYEEGTLPLRTAPCFIDRAEDVQKLIWNLSCDATLSKFLLQRKGRVGIIAKGCDARLITVCVVEKQIAREDVVIIGVPCQGVIDRKKIETKTGTKEILEASVKGGLIKVKGEDFDIALPKDDLLCDSCLTCKHRNPPVYDMLVGEKVLEIGEMDEFVEVSDIEAKPVEERWKHFEEELSRCIRCYACRNVCPLCYCKTCFVDQTMPTWFSKTSNLSDTVIYHMVRAFHMAGRCVDCGACSRVCPMNINLRELVKKIQRILKERFGYEAGLSLEDVPPLGEFKMEDPQEFIK